MPLLTVVATPPLWYVGGRPNLAIAPPLPPLKEIEGFPDFATGTSTDMEGFETLECAPLLPLVMDIEGFPARAMAPPLPPLKDIDGVPLGGLSCFSNVPCGSIRTDVPLLAALPRLMLAGLSVLGAILGDAFSFPAWLLSFPKISGFSRLTDLGSSLNAAAIPWLRLGIGRLVEPPPVVRPDDPVIPAVGVPKRACGPTIPEQKDGILASGAVPPLGLA